jgi:hypothetical protein
MLPLGHACAPLRLRAHGARGETIALGVWRVARVTQTCGRDGAMHAMRRRRIAAFRMLRRYQCRACTQRRTE